MAHIRRRRDNRVGVSPRPPVGRNGSQAASDVSVEEAVVRDVDELPRPAGFGTQASTSQQSSVEIDEYVVPAGCLAEITEVALSLEGNGQATVAVSGVSYGPYDGAIDVSVPLQGSRLAAGDRVRVVHQSTDGLETTTLAQVVSLEV
jgi:hypothetical protein